MGVQITCPACGLDSPDVRCPRCNALKVIGCTGSCALCGSSCKADASSARGTSRPSDRAREDTEHPGTPLQR